MIDISLSSAVFILFLAGFALIVVLAQLKKTSMGQPHTELNGKIPLFNFTAIGAEV
ncbi:hypothetical protein ACFLXQ_00495 [Chloroflexota bacterium]